ncbi:HotDog domain-containing protein [Pilobolus umbonatus]|nr:HotDog domain-containing protein [Pilobolus umbonatus]
MHNTSLETERENLEIVKKCRQDPGLTEFDIYKTATQSQKEHSLTASALRGPDMIAVQPLIFYNKEHTQVTSVLHLGKNVCGHDGIIHGGLSATLLDEGLAYVAFPALPNKMGFTANLNINYRKPILSDQWVVMRTRLDKVDNRKAYVSGHIEGLDGTVYTEATSLYIAPKTPVKTPITK